MKHRKLIPKIYAANAEIMVKNYAADARSRGEEDA